MNKLISLASALLVSISASAQDSTESVAERIQSPFSLGARVVGTGFELDAGFHSGDVYRVGFVFGHTVAEQSTEGGDLSAWQYIEEKESLKGDYALAQFEARLWATPSTRHSVRVLTSGGAMRTRVAYERNRYKPYNGAICPIGDCGKVPEESFGGEDEMNLLVARAGIAYSYVLSRDNRGWLYTIDAGADAMSVLNPQERSVGSGAYHATISSDRLSRPYAHAGLNVRF